jgi:hypothetical protein
MSTNAHRMSETEQTERDNARLRAEARAILQHPARRPVFFVLFNDCGPNGIANDDIYTRATTGLRAYERDVDEKFDAFVHRIRRDFPVFGPYGPVIFFDLKDTAS